MPEFLSPGIFIEEVAAGPRVIQGVSTSSIGIIGYSKEGPTDLATLITSFGGFKAIFGDFTPDSFVPLNVAAFFANGGSRGFMTRVVASDAALAHGFIVNPFTNVSMTPAVGDGVVTVFTHTATGLPVRASSVTVTAGSVTGTDNGAGLITGAGISAGTINYATGAVSVTFSVAPAIATPVRISYQQQIWDLDASSKGVWGNDLQVMVRNNEDFVNYTLGKYTKHDLLVFKKDADAVYQLVETFTGMSFTDANDTEYMPSVVNSGSDLIVVKTPGQNAVPTVLNGTPFTGVAVGTGTGLAQTFTGTLANVPVFKKTVNILCQSVVIATDNGQGKFTGSGVDPTGVNTIDYTTGAYNVKLLGAATPAAAAVTANYFKAPSASVTFTFSAGSDGVAGVTRNEVSSPSLETDRRGIYAFDRPDEIMQLCIPDFAGNVTVAGDQISYAESRKDKFVILTTPSGLKPQEAVDYIRFQFVPNTSYAALYYPWITVTDPLTNRPLNIPPLGHVAGVYARTDTNKNVGKSPGGIDDGKLNFQVGLERVLDKGERDTVYPNRINPLISSAQTGVAVWGVRTLALDPLYRYINARRLLMFLEKSTFNSTHWIVFENNGPDLWTKINLQMTSFLLVLFGNGYFAGTKPADAFFVQVDEKNNPQEVIDAGQVVVDVGVAPNKPAEFVRFRFQQKTNTGG